MTGFYSYEHFGNFGGVEHMIFNVWKDDGRFGSSFSAPVEQTKNNVVALSQMGYRALPHGWSAHDLRAVLNNL